MSRRFGRNQRRRAREAVAASATEAARFKDAYEMADGLARYQGGKLCELQREIDVAKELAAPYSAMFAPEAIEMPGPAMRTVEMHQPERMDLLPSLDEAEFKMLKSVTLDMLLTEIRDDQLDRSMHVLVKFGNEDYAYGISREALNGMSPDGLADRLTAQISRQLAKHIAKRVKATRRSF